MSGMPIGEGNALCHVSGIAAIYVNEKNGMKKPNADGDNAMLLSEPPRLLHSPMHTMGSTTLRVS
jgi:hypothetical protein